MRNYTVSRELCAVKTQPDNSIKFKRSMALVIDLLLWYLLYIVMVFIIFLFTQGIPTVTGDLIYYKEQIDSIITSRTFIIVYLGSLLLYEIVGTMLHKGQSLSKKMFNLRISYEKGKSYSLILRGVIKILILNPYGIIAYLCNQVVPLISINTYANIMLLILAGCMGSTLFGSKGQSLHDMISHTWVIKD